MRYIKKKPKEPKFLKDFKTKIAQGVVVYKDTYIALRDDSGGTFKKLQQVLAKEQGFVCAYCLRALEEKDSVIKMKVEHYQPESIFNGEVNNSRQAIKLCDKKEKRREDLRINYYNLFAVCLGKYTTNGETHCDTPPNGKDDLELCSIPNLSLKKRKQINLRIKYTSNFSVFSEDEDIDKELKDVLNLNEQSLKDKRKHIWNGVAREITIATGLKNWENGGEQVLIHVKATLEKYKKRKRDGSFFEFYDCIVYHLEKKVRILSS